MWKGFTLAFPSPLSLGTGGWGVKGHLSNPAEYPDALGPLHSQSEDNRHISLYNKNVWGDKRFNLQKEWTWEALLGRAEATAEGQVRHLPDQREARAYMQWPPHPTPYQKPGHAPQARVPF